MSPVELLATLLGVLCVVLGVRRSVWTFPTAIGSVLLVGWAVWTARLYSDALLQLFFVGANLYGWANWRRSQADQGDVLVEAMSAGERARWTAGTGASTLAWGGGMAGWTDAAYPWWDAATAVVSAAAQLLMARRKWENWVLWIAVDLALIPLYLAKGLIMLAALYLFYLVLSIWGLVTWRRVLAGRVVPE